MNLVLLVAIPAFYFVALFVYVFTIAWDFANIVNPHHPPESVADLVVSKLLYLTVWNLWCQAIYFSLVVGGVVYAAVRDRSGNAFRTPSSFRSYLCRGVIGPLGVFVFLVFWILYLVDRDLVHPKSLDDVIPAWFIQTSHTFPLITVIVDRFLCDFATHRQKRPILPLVATILIGLAYVGWILYLGLTRSLWVYPILSVLDTWSRIGFIAGCLVVLVACYFFCDLIAWLSWRKKLGSSRKQPTNSTTTPCDLESHPDDL